MKTSDLENAPSQTEIDKRNTDFWNELCGSKSAKVLGIKDSSTASLKKWDDWFFSFYPYLLDRYLNDNYANKIILEVGLGYGSVGQFLGKKGANYHGLDIALGPVQMMRNRFEQSN